MMCKVKRSRSGRPIGRVDLDLPRDPVARDLAQLDRACREIAFCELADALALARISALRGAVSGCLAEIAEGGASDLNLAAETLALELASFEATLPLEQAFRADQRDAAIARLEGAQRGLAGVEAADLDDDTAARLCAALDLTAGTVIAASRLKAAERLGHRI